jgi:5-methylcytosine-specific restriction endonuclease McrA
MFYKEIKCGTYSGYQRHYRLKEPACEPCKTSASAYSMKRYYANREVFLEKMRQHRKGNPKRRAAKNRQKARRRARLKGNRTEPYTLEQVLELYGTICYLCNEEIDMKASRQCGELGWEKGLHLDHVIDIQHGGADAIDNVKPTHALCNISKRSRNDKETPTQGLT